MHVNDNVPKSDHGYIINPYSIFILSNYMVSISVANVYVNSLEKLLLR